MTLPSAFARRIELQAEPCQPPRDRLANGRRVLADPCREHEAVDAAHGRRQHPGKQRDAVDEIVERQLGARIGACQQLAHVVADAGQALQPAFVVEQAPMSLALMPFSLIR